LAAASAAYGLALGVGVIASSSLEISIGVILLAAFLPFIAEVIRGGEPRRLGSTGSSLTFLVDEADSEPIFFLGSP